MSPDLRHLFTLHTIFCYIDPGTGSMVLQLLLGGIASIWVILKLFGKRILSRLGFMKKNQESA